jgi:enterochelin esterase-like enzyme
MIVDELIPLIDESYPTKADASSRVVAGFSMGGAGSARLSLLHPSLFCAAGSWGGGLSRRGTGEDSPLLGAAKANAATLKQNHFAMLLINGDKDRPEAYALLAKTLEPLEIPHDVVVLDDTNHNLGLYHKKSGKAMIEFLGEQLRLGR